MLNWFDVLSKLSTKGQTILKANYGVLNSPKKQTNNHYTEYLGYHKLLSGFTDLYHSYIKSVGYFETKTWPDLGKHFADFYYIFPSLTLTKLTAWWRTKRLFGPLPFAKGLRDFWRNGQFCIFSPCPPRRSLQVWQSSQLNSLLLLLPGKGGIMMMWDDACNWLDRDKNWR